MVGTSLVRDLRLNKGKEHFPEPRPKNGEHFFPFKKSNNQGAFKKGRTP